MELLTAHLLSDVPAEQELLAARHEVTEYTDLLDERGFDDAEFGRLKVSLRVRCCFWKVR